MLSRIRALLAKAESTEFAQEAEALSGRAQELMAKYSIDHALLAAETGRAETPGGRRIAVDNPYEAPKATLLQIVAEANRCRVVWSRELGLVTVIGFPADLDAVELLFTSLLVQANTAMLRTGGKRDGSGRSRTRAFRQSFLLAYAVRIGERLSEAADHAEQAAVAEQRAAAGGTAARRRREEGRRSGAVPRGAPPGGRRRGGGDVRFQAHQEPVGPGDRPGRLELRPCRRRPGQPSQPGPGRRLGRSQLFGGPPANECFRRPGTTW